MPDFTRDETMDDVLSEMARESGEPEKTEGDPEVPVGAHVRAFRETLGMTVQQFAEKTGFSAALLAQIENRMVSPSLGTLVKIANTFGTTVSSFIGGKEEREFSIVRKEDRTTVSRVGLKERGEVHIHLRIPRRRKGGAEDGAVPRPASAALGVPHGPERP